MLYPYDRPLPSEEWRPCEAYDSDLFSTTTVTSAAAWGPRDGTRLVYFASKWWLLGGWWPPGINDWGNVYTTNQVWSSTNLSDWTLELAHDANPPTSGAGARWKPRHTFLTYIHDGKLWVMNSDQYDDVLNDNPIRSDVWNTTDGTTWTRIAASSAFGHGMGVWDPIPATFGGYMHVLGGHREGSQGQDYNDWPATAEHWRSADGVTWEQLPDMPFNRAKVMDGVVLCDKLFIISGNSNTANSRVNPSDTWAWSGNVWRQMSPNSRSEWSGRDYVATASFNNRLWVATGYNVDSGNQGGVRWSRDMGITWERHPAPAWTGSHADAFTLGPDGLVLASGNNQGKSVYTLTVA